MITPDLLGKQQLPRALARPLSHHLDPLVIALVQPHLPPSKRFITLRWSSRREPRLISLIVLKPFDSVVFNTLRWPHAALHLGLATSPGIEDP